MNDPSTIKTRVSVEEMLTYNTLEPLALVFQAFHPLRQSVPRAPQWLDKVY